MNVQILKVSKIKVNPNNPRIIKDDKFKKLVQSITDFPQMLEIRPIVVNKDFIILGGNMRYKACIEAGLTEIPVIIAKDLTPEQEREFLIKDNVAGGEWDWEALANEWDTDLLEEWGLPVWNPDSEMFNIDEDNEETTASAGRASDDGFSTFELIMEHQNKIKLIDLLNSIKIEFAFEKIEDALMEIIRVYNQKK
jgi:hypothetical protein